MDVDAELARELPQRRQCRVMLFGDDLGEQLLALERQNVGHFRRLHIIGAAALGFLDGRQQRRQDCPAARAPSASERGRP